MAGPKRKAPRTTKPTGSGKLSPAERVGGQSATRRIDNSNAGRAERRKAENNRNYWKPGGTRGVQRAKAQAVTRGKAAAKTARSRAVNGTNDTRGMAVHEDGSRRDTSRGASTRAMKQSAASSSRIPGSTRGRHRQNSKRR